MVKWRRVPSALSHIILRLAYSEWCWRLSRNQDLRNTDQASSQNDRVFSHYETKPKIFLLCVDLICVCVCVSMQCMHMHEEARTYPRCHFLSPFNHVFWDRVCSLPGSKQIGYAGSLQSSYCSAVPTLGFYAWNTKFCFCFLSWTTEIKLGSSFLKGKHYWIRCITTLMHFQVSIQFAPSSYEADSDSLAWNGVWNSEVLIGSQVILMPLEHSPDSEKETLVYIMEDFFRKSTSCSKYMDFVNYCLI